MNPIQPSSLIMTISEYGKVVLSYNDTNYDRFIQRSTEMINEHLSRFSKQKECEVKNVTIQYYTY